MTFPRGAPQILLGMDGGCHGWSGATAAEFNYEIQGGRFFSNGTGQPHPRFAGRGHQDQWNVREAMDRAAFIIIGLGTNETNRERYLGLDSPWPIQTGPGRVPGTSHPSKWQPTSTTSSGSRTAGRCSGMTWPCHHRPAHGPARPGHQRPDLGGPVPPPELPGAAVVDQGVSNDRLVVVSDRRCGPHTGRVVGRSGVEGDPAMAAGTRALPGPVVMIGKERGCVSDPYLCRSRRSTGTSTACAHRGPY